MLAVLKDHTMLLWADIPLPKVMRDFAKFVEVLMLIILMDRKVAVSIMAGVLMLAVLMDHIETLLVMLSHFEGRSIVQAFAAIRSFANTKASAIIVIAPAIATVATTARYFVVAPAAITGSPGGLIAPPS